LPCLPRHPVGNANIVKEEYGKPNGVTVPPFSAASAADPVVANNSSPQSVTLAEPWKISAISDALPGYDNGTIREMLKKCRGDIDNAFAKLLDESSPSCSPVTMGGPSGTPSASASLGLSPRTIPGSSSRSSSRHSTASKRSADDSDDDDDGDKIRSPNRRGRGRDRKRRILDGVTVGFSVRHDENGVVSFRLRVDPDADVSATTDVRASPGVVTRQRGKMLKKGVRGKEGQEATGNGADGTILPSIEPKSESPEEEDEEGSG
jgi:hypothetical protein